MKILYKAKHKSSLWVTYSFKLFCKKYWDIVLNNLDESDSIIDAIIAEYIMKYNLKFEYHP